jgi:hypothetical protein
MSMNRKIPTDFFVRMTYLLLGTLLHATFLVPPANSQHRIPQEDPGTASVKWFGSVQLDTSRANSSRKDSLAMAPWTILPVRLNSTISSSQCRPGQVITGRIMQDVPLSAGVRIRAGNKVIGHILEVVPASTGAEARISFQFDKLISSHQTISITTNLRAIAGLMRIIEAQTPPIGAGESDVYRWLTTVQVGGEVVYGQGGPVTSGENANQIVGREVHGGVLGQVRAKAGTKCRGAIDGNDSPQALWVFSSDACGTYGLERLSIAHAGRTDPTGVIVLTSDSGNLKIAGGAGLLLRVNSSHKLP